MLNFNGIWFAQAPISRTCEWLIPPLHRVLSLLCLLAFCLLFSVLYFIFKVDLFLGFELSLEGSDPKLVRILIAPFSFFF